MEPSIPFHNDRQPLLTHIPPHPAEDDEQLSESAARLAHEYDTSHGRPTRISSMIIATILSFLILGLVVSTPGVILPHLEEHYSLSDVQASLIFLVLPLGYLAGAYLNEPIHRRFGQRGICVVAPTCQIIFASLITSLHGSDIGGFEAFLVAIVVGNLGSGMLDGSWCAWAGGLGGRRRNTVQGLLHGSFSVGAGLGPFLSGTMFSVWDAPWWYWYHVLFGAVVLQGLVLCWVFRFEDGRRYCEDLNHDMSEPGVLDAASEEAPTARPGGALRHAVTWICAAYFLAVGQLGAAVGPFAMGWLVQLLGIRGFQVFILAMLVMTLLVYFLFPNLPTTEREGEAPGSTETTIERCSGRVRSERPCSTYHTDFRPDCQNIGVSDLQ